MTTEELQIIVRVNELEKTVADLKKVDKGTGDLDKNSKSLANTFKGEMKEAMSLQGAMKNLAGSVAGAVAITAVVAKLGSGIKDSIQGYYESAEATARLEGVWRATGGAAGVMVGALKNQALELQRLSGVSDETVMAAQTALQSYTSVTGDTFSRVIELAADFQAMGEDMASAATNLGRALEKPAEATRSLRSLNIMLSDATEEAINKMVEQGDVAGAQAIILKEVESRVGGMAERMGSEAPAAAKKLREEIGNLQEGIGGMISGAFMPLNVWLTKSIAGMNDMATMTNLLKLTTTDPGKIESKADAKKVVNELQARIDKANISLAEAKALDKDLNKYALTDTAVDAGVVAAEKNLAELENQMVRASARLAELERKEKDVAKTAAEAAAAAVAAMQRQAVVAAFQTRLSSLYNATLDERAKIEADIAWAQSEINKGDNYPETLAKLKAVIADKKQELADLDIRDADLRNKRILEIAALEASITEDRFDDINAARDLEIDAVQDVGAERERVLAAIAKKYEALAKELREEDAAKKPLSLGLDFANDEDRASVKRLEDLYASTPEGAEESALATRNFVESLRGVAEAGGAGAEVLAKYDAILKNLDTDKGDELEQMADALKDIAKAQLSDSIVSGFEAVGDALVSGGNAGESFAETISAGAVAMAKETGRYAVGAGLRAAFEGKWALAAGLLAIGGVSIIGSSLLGGGGGGGGSSPSYEDIISDSVIAAEERIRDSRLEILRDTLDREKEMRDEKLDEIDDYYSTEFDILRDQWERNLISSDEYASKTADLRTARDAAEDEAEAPVAEAQSTIDALEFVGEKNDKLEGLKSELKTLLKNPVGMFGRVGNDRILALKDTIASVEGSTDHKSLNEALLGGNANDSLEEAKARKTESLNQQIDSLSNEKHRYGSYVGMNGPEVVDLTLADLLSTFSRMKKVADAGSVEEVWAARYGADFQTSGPQLLLVGDNPGGRERVSVEPIGSLNLNGPRSSSGMTVVIQGDVYGIEDFYGKLNLVEAKSGRRGRKVRT